MQCSVFAENVTLFCCCSRIAWKMSRRSRWGTSTSKIYHQKKAKRSQQSWISKLGQETVSWASYCSISSNQSCRLSVYQIHEDCLFFTKTYTQKKFSLLKPRSNQKLAARLLQYTLHYCSIIFSSPAASETSESMIWKSGTTEHCPYRENNVLLTVPARPGT